MRQNMFRPIYSHGGTGASGTVTGTGNTISVIGAVQSCALQITCTGGTATVKIESSGGALDSSGNPPSSSWTDESDGGYSLLAGESVYKSIPAARSPFWRTNITAISGATVTSYIPCMIITDPAGNLKWAQPNYPSISNVQDPSA